MELLDDTHAPLFIYSRGRAQYACNAQLLAHLILTTGCVRDPFANTDFSDCKLCRLDGCTGFQYLVAIQSRNGNLAARAETVAQQRNLVLAVDLCLDEVIVQALDCLVIFTDTQSPFDERVPFAIAGFITGVYEIESLMHQLCTMNDVVKPAIAKFVNQVVDMAGRANPNGKARAVVHFVQTRFNAYLRQ